MAELLDVLLHDTGHIGAGAVLGGVGVQDVVEGLEVEANALDLVVNEPMCAFNGQAGAVGKIVVVLAPALVHAGADENPVAFLDAAFDFGCGLFNVLHGDQLPVGLGNVQADGLAVVVLQGQLVGVGSFRNDMGGGIGVGGVMHMEIVEGLEQAVMHRHMVYAVNVEIAVGGPERIAAAEGVGQVNQYLFSHDV